MTDALDAVAVFLLVGVVLAQLYVGWLAWRADLRDHLRHLVRYLIKAMK
jgi:hypothetical protein